jgi:hypothetical protein
MKNQTVGRRFYLLAVMILHIHALRAAETTETCDATTETVGPSYSGFIHNKFVTPVNQSWKTTGASLKSPGCCPIRV